MVFSLICRGRFFYRQNKSPGFIDFLGFFSPI
nr:MAG TPA: hypothetical protein [Bacteriophage sp.]